LEWRESDRGARKGREGEGGRKRRQRDGRDGADGGKRTRRTGLPPSLLSASSVARFGDLYVANGVVELYVGLGMEKVCKQLSVAEPFAFPIECTEGTVSPT
jgi:hypothetical protein